MTAQLITAQGEVIAADPWRLVELPAEETAQLSLPPYALITLPDWQRLARHAELPDRPWGLRVPGTLPAAEFIAQLGTKAEPAAQLLQQLDLLEIEIENLRDGRCFSLATRLRGQYKFSGELRARGNFIIDQIYFLQRCGFSSFAPNKPLPREQLQQLLMPFSDFYQNSIVKGPTVIEKRLSKPD